MTEAQALAEERDEVLRQLDDRTNQTLVWKRQRWAALVRRQAAEIDRLAAARAVIAEYEHINSGAVRQPLTDAQIINLRDDLLPSQGDSFDCIAFARAIETKHGITA